MPFGTREQMAAAADVELLRRHVAAEYGEDVARPTTIDYELDVTQAPLINPPAEHVGLAPAGRRGAARIDADLADAHSTLTTRLAELQAARTPPQSVFAPVADYLVREEE